MHAFCYDGSVRSKSSPRFSLSAQTNSFGPQRVLTPARLLAMVLCWLSLAPALAAGPAALGTHDWADLGAAQQSLSASESLLYYEDAGNTLTVNDVSDEAHAQQFRPAGTFGSEVNFGYSRSTYWLALPLRVAADAPARWLLEIGFPSLDSVEAYVADPSKAGEYTRLAAGDLQPFAERPFAHRNLVFPVTLAAGAEQILYLKVRSAGTLTIPVTLWQPDALHHHDQASYALFSLYYGMLLALLLYNLLLFLSVREPVFIAYVAFVASMAVGQASLNGFGNQFLWPASPAWGNIALPLGNAAAGFFGALFTRLFLGTRRHFPKLDRLILAMAGLFALAALTPLMPFAASYQAAAVFTTLTGLAFSGVAVGGGVYCFVKGHPGARYFLIAWTLLLIGVAILSLRNLGWVPTNDFTTHAMQIGSALEVLLLSFALADRINSMRREQERLAAETLAAREQLVATLQRSEQELESRVTERTRALETANVALRKKEEELEYLARHDPLTGLANRVMLGDRIASAIARARRSKRAVGVLVADLDGFKAINDAHGHVIGDQMLKAVSARLKACVRETDTVARLGGDEFVLVLEELQDLGDAARIAGKLVETTSWPVNLTHGSLQVSVSVGLAFFPRDATEPNALLKHADNSMYIAKSAGRNRWHAASGI